MKNRGITLVALVVTVIILLIIAGVAVSMITGNDGLFTKANEAGTLYNEEARKEAEWLQQLMDSEYLGGNGTGGNTGSSSGSIIDNSNPSVSTGVANGQFNIEKGVNNPDTTTLPLETTKYITWNKINNTYVPQETSSIPNNWYDYNNGQWANIKTMSEDSTLEAYWVWIPRFAYKLAETGNGNEKEIEVIFIKNDSKTGVMPDGTEVQCYYSTDTEITTNGTGMYIDATDFAKGSEEGQEQAWIIHPAFWWDNNNNGQRDNGEELKGIWFAKFEASSSTPYATNGGGDSVSLKVQSKPGVITWRYITFKNIFTVTRAMQDTGGVIGTRTGNTDIDTHLAKNIEWGAATILTQSKYGIFNPQSSLKDEVNTRVWNNPNTSFITGTVTNTIYTGTNDALTRDVANITDAQCDRYNKGNGIKGSSTGTVYGIYDLAGGSWEYVMAIMATNNNLTTPTVGNSGYTTTTWANTVNSKYYNMYKPGGMTDYTGRGYIGDMTEELLPVATASDSGKIWFNDNATFPTASYPTMGRSYDFRYADEAGIFAFFQVSGGANKGCFRPILLVL